MKLLIVHISDIHLSTKRYPDNYILARTDLILSAIRSMFLTKQEIGTIAILVAGDIAYSGLMDEYELATGFFRVLLKGLKEEFPGVEHHVLFLPGNHDCDFERDGQARQKLIEGPDMTSLGDGTIIDVATSVQDEFFEFCRLFSGSVSAPKGHDRLLSEFQLKIDGKAASFRMLNSAWLSRIRESRSLMLPVQFLSTRLRAAPAPDLVVTAIHHPYNWFEPNNARSLRKLLEETSDVIVTGHEHSADTYTKTGLSGEQNEYIEGGVLQENGAPQSSAFNVILIDLRAATQVVHHFEWTSELYEAVSPAVERPFVRNRNRLKNEFCLQEAFEELLNDADTAYSHPQKEHVTLEDVFLYPDCLDLEERQLRAENRGHEGGRANKSATKVVAGKELINHIQKKKKVIIVAAERAGKTAISRTLFKDLRNAGKIPLLLSGRDIRSASVTRLANYLDDAFARQFGSLLRTRYWQLPIDSRAVIVDDYHYLPANRETRDSFVAEILKRFEVVVLIGGSELRVMELTGHVYESTKLWEFNHLEVMAFGHRLRADFIRKWYRIGREGQPEDEDVVNRMIRLEQIITGILGKDLLPPYPVYLLLLLQQIESVNPHEVSAASYGRLYGAVLTAYLAKSGSAADVETKVSYLTELAYHLCEIKSDHLTDEAIEVWHSDYCQRQLVRLDYQKLLRELVLSQVLAARGGQISFRYKAGFYYFVAQYMSENIANPGIREEIKRLCGQIHREASANIIVFLCHLSNEPLILNTILTNAGLLFADLEETDILKDAAFSAKLAVSDEMAELHLTNPEQNRLKALEHRDANTSDSEREDETYSYRVDPPESMEVELDVATVNINRAVKTIQIAGQILRNYGAKLPGPRKLELADACYALTMRMLKWIYKGFEENEQELIDAARKAICERQEKMDPTAALQSANAMVFGVLKLATFGLIKQVSTAVGLEKLSPVFEALLSRNSTVGRRLIDLSIRLDHYSAVPEESINKLQKDVSDSLLVTDVLRQLVFYRFYYFAAPMPIKQRVCDQVGIRIVPTLLDYDPKRNV